MRSLVRSLALAIGIGHWPSDCCVRHWPLGKRLNILLSNIWDLFDKQCLIVQPSSKHCFTSGICSVMFILKTWKTFMLIRSKYFWRAIFCDVVERSKILLDKQVSNVWHNVWSFGQDRTLPRISDITSPELSLQNNKGQFNPWKSPTPLPLILYWFQLISLEILLFQQESRTSFWRVKCPSDELLQQTRSRSSKQLK